MKEYDVKITETLEKTVTVQAESHDAAEEQVRAAYYNSEYILDSENFTGVAFGTTEEREVQKRTGRYHECVAGKAVHVSAGCADRL